MARISMTICFLYFSISSFAQTEQTMVVNETAFKTVFKNVKSGNYEGTANGVLFIKNVNGQDLILDFQGSKTKLNVERDPDEVYDISIKKYSAQTTSSKSTVEYATYNYGNELYVKLPAETYTVGSLDGASDLAINGLKYYYKAEKDMEYLVLEVEKEITLSNYQSLLKKANYDINQNLRKQEQYITLLPHSTLVFAIKRNK